MSAADDQQQFDELLHRLDAANAARAARVLLLGAVSCVLGAGVALLLDWQTDEHESGVTTRTGYDAAPALVPVVGVIAVVLLVIAYRYVTVPTWSGWATAASGIATLGCLGALHAGAGDGTLGGPAGWLALAGFAAATGMAGLAAFQASRRH